jgi:hypothetical protein
MGLRGHGETAGWHLIDIPADEAPITIARRGLGPTGGIGLLDTLVLTPP